MKTQRTFSELREIIKCDDTPLAEPTDLDENFLRNASAAVLFTKILNRSKRIKGTKNPTQKMDLIGSQNIHLAVASNWKISISDLGKNESIKYGLGAGIGFAMASLWLREASLSLMLPRLLSASAVLAYMVVMQTAICLAWIGILERDQFAMVRARFKACLFIGFTSVAGSVGWFTAMSLQNAAIVKTLGQAEFLLTLIITYFYFRERISGREIVGILLVALSVMLLLFAT